MRPTPCARRVHRGPSPGPVDASPSQEDDGGANGTRTSSISCGANRERIGAVKAGNGDERDPLPAIGPEPAVSGPDADVSLSEDPAKARRFLGGSPVLGAQSPQPQTSWRSGSDSNRRYPLGYACFQGRCLRPLGHRSTADCSAEASNSNKVEPRFRSGRVRGKALGRRASRGFACLTLYQPRQSGALARTEGLD
jgi:hypothetical protein